MCHYTGTIWIVQARYLFFFYIYFTKNLHCCCFKGNFTFPQPIHVGGPGPNFDL